MKLNKLGDTRGTFLKHGYASGGKVHPMYTSWLGMKQRCQNPKATSYPWYGAIGIKVCERWQSFKAFAEDMGPTWKKGLEIDRISSKGNYEPGNCQWSGHREQLRNYSRNTWYEFNGVRMVSTDWAKKLNANHRIIPQRLRLGWTLEEALTTPVVRTNYVSRTHPL